VKITETALPEVLILEPRVFGDERGFFMESWNAAAFKEATGVELSGENKRQLWVPPGFAHGFVVLSESADFLYKTTDYYAPAHERALVWNDAHVAVQWPLHELRGVPQLSAKDDAAPHWDRAEFFD
jgi:dTDP-4-dehydrorhamnose 3,5-epimerase